MQKNYNGYSKQRLKQDSEYKRRTTKYRSFLWSSKSSSTRKTRKSSMAGRF